jgi:RHS repeat-associated protein
MGARQYAPVLGRFLETDPVEGGSCSDYDYVCGSPLDRLDLDGTRAREQR